MAPNFVNFERRVNAADISPKYKMTMEEFKEKCKNYDWDKGNLDQRQCLLAIMGKIYDVTCWMEQHPGGSIVLQSLNGKDATDHFYTTHSNSIIKYHLPRFYVGEISDYKQTPLQKDFYEIKSQLEKEGIFEPPYTWYITHFSILAFILMISVYLATTSSNFFALMFSAFLLGIFWQQMSFLGHDFGHNSVFKNRWHNQIGGLISTALFGVSGGWWKRVHNVHHVVPNSQEGDPDIQYLPLFAVGEKGCNDYYSFFHKRVFKFDKLAKLLVSYQHIIYVPILIVARFNLYAQSSMLIWNTSFNVANRNLEKFCQLVFFTWVSLLVLSMPSWEISLMYLLVSHSVCGIIHIQIVLSHFPMEIYHGLGHTDESNDFIHTQLRTTTNIDCWRFMDWFHGGLQFQVEHHLFPRIPRPNLRHVMTKYIVPLCKKHNLEHHSCSFVEVNWKVYETMRVAAMCARADQSTPTDVNDSFIGRILNADG